MRGFLESFAKHRSVVHACAETGRSRSSAYEWRDLDKVFAEVWDEIEATRVDLMIDNGIDRATFGTHVPVYQNGRLVGWKIEYANGLIPFFAAALNQRFRRAAAGATPGGPSTPEEHAALIRAALGQIDERVASGPAPADAAPADGIPPGASE